MCFSLFSIGKELYNQNSCFNATKELLFSILDLVSTLWRSFFDNWKKLGHLRKNGFLSCSVLFFYCNLIKYRCRRNLKYFTKLPGHGTILKPLKRILSYLLTFEICLVVIWFYENIIFLASQKFSKIWHKFSTYGSSKIKKNFERNAVILLFFNF